MFTTPPSPEMIDLSRTYIHLLQQRSEADKAMYKTGEALLAAVRAYFSPTPPMVAFIVAQGLCLYVEAEANRVTYGSPPTFAEMPTFEVAPTKMPPFEE